ncbi:MAG: hydroxyphenylacetyl-CoA thioesterase PaaI [Betaproteobacteria bacterium]|nr:hydroxyphenylacetyl-CoA thioesterase PaaI [Betaproteobacteria bacterium]MBL8534754.1 hydroxyphenylacetyl-CoA thioesterase PaaI [Betaproteobacteria bacterium]
MTPQETADHVGRGMMAVDAASQGMGIRIDAMAPGYCRMQMKVRPEMLNGFKICHGGFITTLADSAFAFACNSYNELTVAAGVVVDFLAPANLDDVLTAEAKEVSLAGRTGVYDVTVRNQAGVLVAVLRGRSHRMKDRKTVPE